MSPKLKALYDRRAKAVADARAIMDRAKAENRDLTADEVKHVDAFHAECDTVKGEITALEAAESREARTVELELQEGEHRERQARRAPLPTPDPDFGQRAERREPDAARYDLETRWGRVMALRASPAYRAGFAAYLRVGLAGIPMLPEAQRVALMNPELRALIVGTDTAGGMLVPEDMERAVVVAMEEEVAMRQLATIVATAGQKPIPTIQAPADEGTSTLTAESAGYTESDVVFAEKVLNAFKLARLIRISEELVNDEAVGLLNLLPTWIAQRLGRAEETWFVNGTGSGQPRGLVLDAAAGVAAASASVITADEVINLHYSVRRPYRARSSYLMNDATVLVVRKLKDTTNQYLWQPGMASGEPDRLLGRPVFTSAAMPTIATTARVIAFGDMSYYWIGDRGPRWFRRLDERYAELGQVGFISGERVDGVLTVTEAVKRLTMA